MLFLAAILVPDWLINTQAPLVELSFLPFLNWKLIPQLKTTAELFNYSKQQFYMYSERTNFRRSPSEQCWKLYKGRQTMNKTERRERFTIRRYWQVHFTADRKQSVTHNHFTWCCGKQAVALQSLDNLTGWGSFLGVLLRAQIEQLHHLPVGAAQSPLV